MDIIIKIRELVAQFCTAASQCKINSIKPSIFTYLPLQIYSLLINLKLEIDADEKALRDIIIQFYTNVVKHRVIYLHIQIIGQKLDGDDAIEEDFFFGLVKLFCIINQKITIGKGKENLFAAISESLYLDTLAKACLRCLEHHEFGEKDWHIVLGSIYSLVHDIYKLVLGNSSDKPASSSYARVKLSSLQRNLYTLLMLEIKVSHEHLVYNNQIPGSLETHSPLTIPNLKAASCSGCWGFADPFASRPPSEGPGTDWLTAALAWGMITLGSLHMGYNWRFLDHALRHTAPVKQAAAAKRTLNYQAYAWPPPPSPELGWERLATAVSALFTLLRATRKELTGHLPKEVLLDAALDILMALASRLKDLPHGPVLMGHMIDAIHSDMEQRVLDPEASGRGSQFIFAMSVYVQATSAYSLESAPFPSQLLDSSALARVTARISEFIFLLLNSRRKEAGTASAARAAGELKCQCMREPFLPVIAERLMRWLRSPAVAAVPQNLRFKLFGHVLKMYVSFGLQQLTSPSSMLSFTATLSKMVRQLDTPAGNGIRIWIEKDYVPMLVTVYANTIVLATFLVDFVAGVGQEAGRFNHTVADCYMPLPSTTLDPTPVSHMSDFPAQVSLSLFAYIIPAGLAASRNLLASSRLNYDTPIAIEAPVQMLRLLEGIQSRGSTSAVCWVSKAYVAHGLIPQLHMSLVRFKHEGIASTESEELEYLKTVGRSANIVLDSLETDLAASLHAVREFLNTGVLDELLAALKKFPVETFLGPYEQNVHKKVKFADMYSSEYKEFMLRAESWTAEVVVTWSLAWVALWHLALSCWYTLSRVKHSFEPSLSQSTSPDTLKLASEIHVPPSVPEKACIASASVSCETHDPDGRASVSDLAHGSPVAGSASVHIDRSSLSASVSDLAHGSPVAGSASVDIDGSSLSASVSDLAHGSPVAGSASVDIGGSSLSASVSVLAHGSPVAGSASVDIGGSSLSASVMEPVINPCFPACTSGRVHEPFMQECKLDQATHFSILPSVAAEALRVPVTAGVSQNACMFPVSQFVSEQAPASPALPFVFGDVHRSAMSISASVTEEAQKLATPLSISAGMHEPSATPFAFEMAHVTARGQAHTPLETPSTGAQARSGSLLSLTSCEQVTYHPPTQDHFYQSNNPPHQVDADLSLHLASCYGVDDANNRSLLSLMTWEHASKSSTPNETFEANKSHQMVADLNLDLLGCSAADNADHHSLPSVSGKRAHESPPEDKACENTEPSHRVITDLTLDLPFCIATDSAITETQKPVLTFSSKSEVGLGIDNVDNCSLSARIRGEMKQDIKQLGGDMQCVDEPDGSNAPLLLQINTGREGQESLPTLQVLDANIGLNTVECEVMPQEEMERDKGSQDTGGDSVNLNNQAVSISKEAVSIREEAVSISKEAVSIREEAVSISEEAVSISKEAVSISKEAVSISEEAVSMSEEAVSISEEAVSISEEAVSISKEQASRNENRSVDVQRDLAHTWRSTAHVLLSGYPMSLLMNAMLTLELLRIPCTKETSKFVEPGPDNMYFVLKPEMKPSTLKQSEPIMFRPNPDACEGAIAQLKRVLSEVEAELQQAQQGCKETFSLKTLSDDVFPPIPVGCWSMRCTNMSGHSEGALKTRLCTRCRQARYCCRQCQQDDWFRHRANCQPWERAIP